MFTPVDWDLETIEAYGINSTIGCLNGWDYDAPKGAASVMTEASPRVSSLAPYSGQEGGSTKGAPEGSQGKREGDTRDSVRTDLPVMVTVLGVLGKFFIAGAYNTCYIFTTESYPTSLRQNGLGLALTCACVGGIVAPLVRLLEVYHFSLPRVIFGIFPILAGCLCLLLPETKNKELQDHIDPK
ncbi:Solute carrier family 22 member 13 [Takifugu flavidus]|uniref:Solute carrier family 22 member 13 n=1 Tax=Takifugu flavidus TaxID=433684 RepID=A0A5C6NVV0_9TELE|nr:Solute carrier family 22 member 13 [Takifugu flavidus]